MGLLTAWLVGTATAVALALGGTPSPACFGAASRAPGHDCNGGTQYLSVTPSEGAAVLDLGAPCTLVRAARPLVCSFGPAAAGARQSIASVGDSHSAHWRAALTVVANHNRWHGLQLYESGCPFSLAPRITTAKNRFRACQQWRKQALAWFGHHPEVHTVFVSEHNVQVHAPPGVSQIDAEMKGYVDAWAALPATVKQIVVIRDVPYNNYKTNDCIARAVRRRRSPGIACEIPIGEALHTDAAVLAAQQLKPPRVSVVDMTPYFCSTTFCFPVIGGVRVHKDDGHITQLFSRSLGPFLRVAIDRALAQVAPAGAATRNGSQMSGRSGSLRPLRSDTKARPPSTSGSQNRISR
jgi:hypothetical protein